LDPTITIYTVNTTSDVSDGSCTDGSCSLRDAILLANAATKPVEIRFNIPVCIVCTITPLSALPTISGGSITIDGYSQPGSSPATESTPADLVIELDGTNVTNNGLNVTSADNVIKGLVINRFGWAGISLWGANAHHNLITGNYIGIHAGGTSPQPNLGGVVIGSGAHDNTVGGNTPADRNVISGNTWNGVSLDGSNTSYNTIAGNFIGTTVLGEDWLPNNWVGVTIGNGAHHNTVGGDTVGEGNLISGNGQDGVYINGSATVSNTVSGNYIGVHANGIDYLSNGWHGVRIDGGAKYNRIGGNTDGERNVISGNDRAGVRIQGAGTSSNMVSGNYIGLGIAGASMGNEWSGVEIMGGASYNSIGTRSPGKGNIISGNGRNGVYLSGSGTVSNTIAGNLIGTTRDGATYLPNADSGVVITDSASYNLIGGDTDSERNVISGNFDEGVLISSNGTAHNTVSGNYIGTNVTGTAALLNHDGVTIRNGAQYNLIGGDTLGEHNLISGNTWGMGVMIEDGDSLSGTLGNVVSGNYIGLDASGTLTLPNSTGVVISSKAKNNLIGGDTPGERNVISGNTSNGVWIQDAETTGNVVRGNYIGTDASGAIGLGNDSSGVEVYDSPQSCTIGPDNLIAYNVWNGVSLFHSTTIGITITRNSIFSNYMGIALISSANGNIPRPTILSNTLEPIQVMGTTCPSCRVEVFGNLDSNGEGRYYLGSTTADASGYFTVTARHLYPYLTATATDPISGTSEFSFDFETDLPTISLPVIMVNYGP
jgi:titin